MDHQEKSLRRSINSSFLTFRKARGAAAGWSIAGTGARGLGSTTPAGQWGGFQTPNIHRPGEEPATSKHRKGNGLSFRHTGPFCLFKRTKIPWETKKNPTTNETKPAQTAQLLEGRLKVMTNSVLSQSQMWTHLSPLPLTKSLQTPK